MISFFTPCLRWKILVAYKGQHGWPGFQSPFATRYLTMALKVTNDQSGLTNQFTGLPDGLPITVTDYTFGIDRITGRGLAANPSVVPDFPYADAIATSPPGETWEVIGDTYFKHIVPYAQPPLGGLAYEITEVTLSNPYTTTQLDADANALLAAVDLTKMDWFTAQIVQNAEVFFPIGPYTLSFDTLANLLPPDVIGFSLSGIQTNIPVPVLPAAAWYVFTPGFVGRDTWYPNGYLKAVGWFSMAGNYALQTNYINYQQQTINQTSATGIGSCAASFEVTPPPLGASQLPIAPGQDGFVLLEPNSP
jgi:hypothetical protein